MRRLFTVPTTRSVFAAAAFSRWQSEKTASGTGAEENAKTNAAGEVSEIDKVKKAIEENKKLFEEVRKEILYTAANAENARKEFRQNVETEKFKGENAFAKELLESADALDAVCKSIVTYRAEKPDIPGNIASLLNGVDLSLKVVLKVLGRYGVTRMEVKPGDAFDAETMQSILTTPATEEIKAGQVSEVVKTGYFRKGQVLRAAQVGVAEATETK